MVAGVPGDWWCAWYMTGVWVSDHSGGRKSTITSQADGCEWSGRSIMSTSTSLITTTHSSQPSQCFSHISKCQMILPAGLYDEDKSI